MVWGGVFRNGRGLRPSGWLLAGNVARTRCRLLARRLCALSRRHCSGHDRVQRTVERTLAAVEPDSGDGAGPWTRYVARWTAWNHVRTAAALAAAASLTIALVTGSAGHLGAAPCARQDFVDTNVAGALNLPEETVRQGVEGLGK